MRQIPVTLSSILHGVMQIGCGRSHLTYLHRVDWKKYLNVQIFEKINDRMCNCRHNVSLVPRLSKSALGGEEESLVSAVYACASFTQGKPYSVHASSVSKMSPLVM